MGTGQVLSAEPESLRRIYSFNEDRFNHDFPQVRNILPALAQNATAQRVLQEQLRSLNRIDSPDPLVSLLECNYNTYHANGGTTYDMYDNDTEYRQVDFKNNVRQTVPHIDGVLQDIRSGDLYYYIAVGEIRRNRRNVPADEITVGAEVEYTNQYCGVCEVLLRDRRNNDYVRYNGRSVVVRYVEVYEITPPAQHQQANP